MTWRQVRTIAFVLLLTVVGSLAFRVVVKLLEQ